VLSDVVSSVFLSYFYFFTGHVAEPLEEVRGTPGFRGTQVEKHWCRFWTEYCSYAQQYSTVWHTLVCAFVYRYVRLNRAWFCLLLSRPSLRVKLIIASQTAIDRGNQTWRGAVYKKKHSRWHIFLRNLLYSSVVTISDFLLSFDFC